MISLLLTGWFQVCLITTQTFALLSGNVSWIFVNGFALSFVWTFNIKRVVLGRMRDRISYATGAGLGSLSGLVIARYLGRMG